LANDLDLHIAADLLQTGSRSSAKMESDTLMVALSVLSWIYPVIVTVSPEAESNCQKNQKYLKLTPSKLLVDAARSR
jgi:hypothetical protein